MDHPVSADPPPLTEGKAWLAFIHDGRLGRSLRPDEVVRLLHGDLAGVDGRVVLLLGEHVIRQATAILFHLFGKRVLRTHCDLPQDWGDAVQIALARFDRALKRRDTADGRGLREDFFNRVLMMGKGAVRAHDRRIHGTKVSRVAQVLSDGQVVAGLRRDAPVFEPLEGEREKADPRRRGSPGRHAELEELRALAKVRVESTPDEAARRMAVGVMREGAIAPVARLEGVSRGTVERALANIGLGGAEEARARPQDANSARRDVWGGGDAVVPEGREWDGDRT